jgi:hypothetical protein
MTRKTKTLSLAILFAITTLPAYAATPGAQPAATPTQPVAASSLLAAILAPAVTPAPTELSLGSPYLGYCSATCSRCVSSNTTPCPPDPDTGLRQACTRTPVC